jgi:hypothetical protein
MAGDDQDQAPGSPRPSGASRGRLVELHRWAPGQAARPIPVAIAFLMAASTPEERETAAQAHDAQAAQLRGPIPAALASAYLELQSLWQAVGFRILGPSATVAQLLALAPPEQAERVRADLTGAGIDPDATGWPPPGPIVG